MKPNQPVGIIGWGAYIPQYRIKVKTIAEVWGTYTERYTEGLGIEEKAVAGPDEDTITISIEAAQNALKRAQIEPVEIGAVLTGSESPPYAVKPTGCTVAEVIGTTPNILAADLEFACKAGTEAMQLCMGLVSSGMIKYGMAIGADVAQSAPGDDLEYAAAAGGAAFIIGKLDERAAACIAASSSYVTDTPDFWRRAEQPYPKHGGVFTGQSYFQHVISAGEQLMGELGMKPQDFQYAIFHQPNGKFPEKAAKRLGFTSEQIRVGKLVDRIGNTYSGCIPLSLSAVLEAAKPGDNILVVSYGSGAGSDAFHIVVQDAIEEKRDLAPTVQDYINRKEYVGYACYAKWRRMIIGLEAKR
ncbi:MAG: hydroxymethylglutaryl-CoA synthase [Candidatus Freyarchaeota archaeon]|nr:hydroxymethylglutaryl-CoA synthase [Candidatus Freyarchaeota archaeon]